MIVTMLKVGIRRRPVSKLFPWIPTLEATKIPITIESHTHQLNSLKPSASNATKAANENKFRIEVSKDVGCGMPSPIRILKLAILPTKAAEKIPIIKQTLIMERLSFRRGQRGCRASGHRGVSSRGSVRSGSAMRRYGAVLRGQTRRVLGRRDSRSRRYRRWSAGHRPASPCPPTRRSVPCRLI